MLKDKKVKVVEEKTVSVRDLLMEKKCKGMNGLGLSRSFTGPRISSFVLEIWFPRNMSSQVRFAEFWIEIKSEFVEIFQLRIASRTNCQFERCLDNTSQPSSANTT
jgi:hypothetical protein